MVGELVPAAVVGGPVLLPAYPSIHFLTGCTARGKALVGSAWIEIRLEAGRERLPCTTECWW